MQFITEAYIPLFLSALPPFVIPIVFQIETFHYALTKASWLVSLNVYVVFNHPTNVWEID